MLLEVGFVILNELSPNVLLGIDSALIVGVGMLTVNVAVVESDVYRDVSACAAVIVVVPLFNIFTSYTGSNERPDTQFEDEPVSVKAPLSVPVFPPLRRLLETVVMDVFVPLATPWLNL